MPRPFQTRAQGRRRVLPALFAAFLSVPLVGPGIARAGSPETSSGDKTARDKPKRSWIRHEIIPGETLQTIADRYGVHRKSLIRWNKLDPDRPRLYAGKKLKVYAEQAPPERIETTYVVQFGDTWKKIGDAHGVEESDVRRWNLRIPRRFKAGQKLTLWLEPEDLEEEPEWVEGEDGPTRSGKTGKMELKSDATLPIVKVRSSSLSVGRPSRGRISSSAQLPENPALYSRLRPEEAYASSHMIHTLQLAIARWRRDSGYSGRLVIAALSKKGGGRLSPHKSHQSGRDADLRLPVNKGVKGSLAQNISDVDWEASWGLVHALIATGEMQYIFLSYDRQKHLYKAAKKAGAKKEDLDKWIQYPRPNRSNNGVVRHAAGHTSHIHVRVFCSGKETRCEKH